MEIFGTVEEATDDGVCSLYPGNEVTDINSEHVSVMIIAFPLQQWLHERASVLLYTYIVCLANLNKRRRCANSEVNGSMMKMPDCCKMNAASEFQVCLIIALYQSVFEPQRAASQLGRTKGFLPLQEVQ